MHFSKKKNSNFPGSGGLTNWDTKDLHFQIRNECIKWGNA